MRKWHPVKNHLNIYEYDTKRGKRYGVRKAYNDLSGKSKEFTSSGMKTVKEAELVLHKWEVKFAEMPGGNFKGENMTLDQMHKIYTDFQIKNGSWKYGTEKNNRNYYNHYLKPAFGRQKLSKITRYAYENFLADLGKPERNLAKTTIHTINSNMQAIMNFAEDHDFIIKNRLRKPIMNGGRKERNKTIEPADYNRWLKTAEDILSKYEYAIILLSTLGERRGELMGLRYKDVKLSKDKQSMAITWTVQRTATDLLGTTLKTASSYRTNVISGYMMQQLQFIIKHSKVIMKNFSRVPSNKDFMMVNPNTGRPFHPYTLNKFFKKVNDQTGLHFTPHMLRHNFATLGMNNPNISDIEIMHWLGHTNLQMTTDYTRPTLDASEKTFENMSDVLHVIKPNDDSSSTGS